MEYPKVICKECGKEEEARYLEPTLTKMLEESLCFFCDFWSEWVGKKDRPEVARIEGRHYWVNPLTSDSRWNGFGGQRFKIRWFDGREQETNNLWHQGEIPAHFRERLPDNATWGKRDE